MFQKGTARRKTTESAGLPTRAVGYVRVSTDQQVTEGVSLDAQRAKLRAYAVLHDIELVSICSDEGLSASTLKRPGLQKALGMLQDGRADALLVSKLDRLTRSVRDLGALCESYFADGLWSLLSVADSIDTRSAAGRLVLNVLTSVAEWERGAVSERTRASMQHLKEKGVHVGAAPYGWRYGDEVDAAGRRRRVEDAEAQKMIERIVAMHRGGAAPSRIARTLRQERLPGPRGGQWSTNAALRVLTRAGCQVKRRQQRPARGFVCDMPRAREVAAAGRAGGLSLRQIAAKLGEAHLTPPRGGAWHAASVLSLLAFAAPTTARARARQLRAGGLSYREIGLQLGQEGYVPERAARWHNQAIAAMLV